MQRTLWLGTCAVVLGLLACKKDKQEVPPGPETPPPVAAPAQGAAVAGKPAGSYTISSASNPGGGGGYSGSVVITHTEPLYKLAWTISDGSQYQGVGLLEGDVLGVGWGVASEFGVAVYKVEGGKLTGRWATAGSSSAGTENLEGPAGLNGTYKVTSATNAGDGKAYTGSVTIKPNGAIHNVTWKLTDRTFSGVGVLQGSTFVVGWGEAGKGAGVVFYRVKGNQLDGSWAQPGGSALGTEVLSPK